MLTHLWRERFGDGVIDTCIDPATQSLSIADVSGRVCIVDYYGNVLFDTRRDMPAWGVAHQTRPDGTIVIAVAESSKSPMRGAVSLYHDDVLVGRREFPHPVWDVCLLNEGDQLVASDWAGYLHLFETETLSLQSSHAGPAPLYGLDGKSLADLWACADRTGLVRYSVEHGQMELVQSVPSACYNLRRSGDGRKVLLGTHGPRLSLFSLADGTSQHADAIDVRAVAFYRDLILFGDESRSLRIRSPQSIGNDLTRVELNADIWNIAVDEGRGLLFVAVGDGTIASFQLEITLSDLEYAEDLLGKRAKGNAPSLPSVAARVHPTYLSAIVLEDLNNGRLSKADAANLYEALRTCEPSATETNSARNLTLGVLAVACDHLTDAIAHLSVIDRSSVEFQLAVTLTARAHMAVGQQDEARRLLAKHIDEFGDRFQRQSIQILESTGLRLNGTSDRLQELRTANTPARLSQFVADDISLFRTDSRSHSDEHNRVDYGLINYIRYEYAERSDHAKKVLEMAAVDEILAGVLPADPNADHRSLDIGCATCRWPKYFSARGYKSCGYDIDPEAVRICRAIAEGNPRIEIYEKNILRSPPEENRYSIVTSMMGTFNHIPREQQFSFLDWICKSLVAGGTLLFSTWVAEGPYTTYLKFYNPEERHAIQANCPSAEELRDLIGKADLQLVAMRPFVFLPDVCYESWLGMADGERAIIAVEATCRKCLPDAHSQMMLFVARKP